MKRKIFILFLSVVSVFSFYACEDHSDLTAPAPPATGSADFSRLVSVGNSLTAGIQSNSLFESAQNYTIGNQIAKQVGGVQYAQPLVSDPGIGQRIEILSIAPSVAISYNNKQGTPLNTAYPAPYNNLGISGAILYDILDSTDFAAKSAQRANPYFSLVLRNASFGNSIYAQAKKLNPTFILLDIGNNDALGYGLSGGTSGTDQTRKLPTEPAVFAALFNQLMAKIMTEMPNTKVAVANIPDINAIPFFNTVGPQIAANIKPLVAAKLINGIYYQKSTDVSAIGTGLSADLKDVFITLYGMQYATLLGDTTGKYYALTGKTPGAGINTKMPFGFHPYNPWPNELILDANEQSILSAAIASFNQTIQAAAALSPNFVLVDINKLFATIKAGDLTGGTNYNGVIMSTSYILGELFSLDGVHPSSRGYAVFANEYIKAINAKWGANIPLINVSTVPSSNPLSKQALFAPVNKFIAEPGAIKNIQY